MLALVPSGRYGGGLLRLRQVCKRWKSIIGGSSEGGSPAVWRHRTVQLVIANSGETNLRSLRVRGEFALICAPTLRRVVVEIKPSSRYNNCMSRVLLRLAKYSTKVSAKR